LGIRQLGYWTTAIGPDSNALTYILVWDSLADGEAKWGKFVTDSEWVRVRTTSEASGQMVAKMDSVRLLGTVSKHVAKIFQSGLWRSAFACPACVRRLRAESRARQRVRGRERRRGIG
jgi:hypothetical protein